LLWLNVLRPPPIPPLQPLIPPSISTSASQMKTPPSLVAPHFNSPQATSLDEPSVFWPAIPPTPTAPFQPCFSSPISASSTIC
jgi:hypothetical protein